MASLLSFDKIKTDNAIIVMIIPIIFKNVGVSENIKHPNIVADIGSAPPHKMTALPFSI